MLATIVWAYIFESKSLVTLHFRAFDETVIFEDCVMDKRCSKFRLIIHNDIYLWTFCICNSMISVSFKQVQGPDLRKPKLKKPSYESSN